MASPSFDLERGPDSRDLPRIVDLGAAELPRLIEPFALVTPLEGELLGRSGDESFHLRSCELLVLRGGEPVELTAGSGCVRVLLFHASPAWVEGFCALHGLAGGAEAGEPERLVAGASLARRAARLLGAATRSAAAAAGRAAPTAVAALLEIALQARGEPLSPQRSWRQASARRQSLIRALASYDPEAEGDLSLYELAEQLGLSSRQTARLVRGETGRSFRELKASARLERARKLLASSDLSILEVALRAGWNSASQFHDAFRRSVGVTPARYREAHRG